MKAKAGSQKSKVKSQRPHAPAPKTLPLLIEIGCEEIPARFLAVAQRRLEDQLRQFLTANRLLATRDGQQVISKDEAATIPIHTYATPRRLVAHVPTVLSQQPDLIVTTEGPPVKVAIGPDGRYTRAAEAFAARNGAELSDLKRVSTAKGEYLMLEKRQLGMRAAQKLGDRPAGDLITPGILTLLLANWDLSSMKSMYWENAQGPKFRFIRPIRWLLALMGEGKNAEVVPFAVPGVESSQFTYWRRLGVMPAKAGSHSAERVFAGQRIRVTGFRDFMEKLRAEEVEIDPTKRREMIRAKSKALLEASERLVEDAELETWHVNSTEWPSAIAGDFDHRFLSLPREILITVMRDHQKYFAVESRDGGIRPRFIAILNRRQSDPKGVIRAGHERVLRARFTDAQFFWTADQKIPLRDRLPLLEKVTYHEKLGSYADKVKRMESIAKEICAALEGQGKLGAEDRAHVLRAIDLCKCDLITQMVQEFTELQGVVGGLYARAQGEPQEVAEAIYDHYKPLTISDDLPRTITGRVVSLSDRIDSVIGAFRAGLQPTGSSDPFGVRRAANGIIKILLEGSLPLSVQELFLPAMRAHELDPASPPSSVTPDRLWSFFKERQEYYFEEFAGLRYDTVRAVLALRQESDDPVDSFLRAKALEKVRDTEDFISLATAAKRTRNILDKSASDEDRRAARQGSVYPQLFEVEAERALFGWSEDWLNVQAEATARRDYERLFQSLAEARSHVDRFFDSVMVMVTKDDVRRNRLSLLARLDKTVFRRFADLSLIESSTLTSVDAPTSENQ